MPDKIPAEWLPQAVVKVTVVWTHPEYDDTVERIEVARDWQARGENYLRSVLALDGPTRILAVFDGWHDSRLGSAVNA